MYFLDPLSPTNRGAGTKDALLQERDFDKERQTMTFSDITKLMLNSMDFFELRRTAGRYAVSFQGVRRQKLIKDIEKKILEKNLQGKQRKIAAMDVAAGQMSSTALDMQMSEGATSARPEIKRETKKVVAKINTFSARHAISRSHIEK